MAALVRGIRKGEVPDQFDGREAREEQRRVRSSGGRSRLWQSGFQESESQSDEKSGRSQQRQRGECQRRERSGTEAGEEAVAPPFPPLPTRWEKSKAERNFGEHGSMVDPGDDRATVCGLQGPAPNLQAPLYFSQEGLQGLAVGGALVGPDRQGGAVFALLEGQRTEPRARGPGHVGASGPPGSVGTM